MFVVVSRPKVWSFLGGQSLTTGMFPRDTSKALSSVGLSTSPTGPSLCCAIVGLTGGYTLNDPILGLRRYILDTPEPVSLERPGATGVDILPLHGVTRVFRLYLGIPTSRPCHRPLVLCGLVTNDDNNHKCVH